MPIKINDILGMVKPNPMQGLSPTELFMMGFGKAARDTGTGLGQVARGMLPIQMADNMGLPTRADFDRTEEDDAPLMDTTPGMLGHTIGGLALISLPGMTAAKFGAKIPKIGQSIASLGEAVYTPSSPLKNGIGGGILGGTMPIGEDDSRLQNIGTMGLLGATLPSLVKRLKSNGGNIK